MKKHRIKYQNKKITLKNQIWTINKNQKKKWTWKNKNKLPW